MHPVDTDYLLVHRLYYELSCVVLQPFFCALHNRLHSCWRTYCINGSSSMNPVHMFPTMGPFHSIHTLGDVPDMHLPVRDERGEWGRGKPEGWPLPIRLFLLLVLQL